MHEDLPTCHYHFYEIYEINKDEVRDGRNDFVLFNSSIIFIVTTFNVTNVLKRV
jgi:hypothetical protein